MSEDKKLYEDVHNYTKYKLVEMLIKASTKENDKAFILFGGSGNEILLCKELKRQFISAEIDKKYYDMIIDRLKNGGAINDEYKLQFTNNSEVKYYCERSDIYLPRLQQPWISFAGLYQSKDFLPILGAKITEEFQGHHTNQAYYKSGIMSPNTTKSKA